MPHTVTLLRERIEVSAPRRGRPDYRWTNGYYVCDPTKAAYLAKADMSTPYFNQPTQAQIAKCLFGVITSLDGIFEGPFLYTPTVWLGKNNGTSHPRPPGYMFFSGIDFGDPSKVPYIQTFEQKHMSRALAAKPREAVLAAGDFRCMEGRLNSFKINHWRERGLALITATDRTMIPSVWIALIDVANLPTITLDNTESWKP